MKEKRIKKNLVRSFNLIIILLIFAPFLLKVFENYGKFFGRGYQEQYKAYEKAYYNSQYANPEANGFIPDEVFEEFAAGAFLRGMNPIHIVHDHPPLGRYILSLSILLFDNAKTIVIIALLISYLGIFLISKLIVKNFILSLIPLALFVNEPLNLNKLSYAPLPEPVQLPFIVFAIYVFLLSLKQKDKRIYYILTALLIGFVISIRFFVTGVLIALCMILFIILFKRSIKKAFNFAFYLPLSLIILILSYTQTIKSGYTIIETLGIQKYILTYHKSAFVNAFSFWDLIIFNRWHTWWGQKEILSDPHWILFWPISIFINAFALFFALIKRISYSPEEKFLYIWVILYTLMLSTGYTSTRYFLPLLPFLYILAVSSAIKIYLLVKNASIYKIK